MKTTTQGQPVGKAFIVYGTVKAISPGGLERVLAPNSLVYANDRIVTGADGSVSIHFTNGAAQLDLGRMSNVAVDEDVYADQSQPGESTAGIADIQSAMAQNPDFDPTTDLPAPAAGDIATGLRGGGRQLVVFTPDQMEVTPDSGAETIGVALDFLDPPPVDILPQEEGLIVDQTLSAPPASIVEPPDEPPIPPPPVDTVPTIGSVDRSIDEANLADGTSPNANALTTSGTLADLGVSFGNNTPGILDFGNGNVIVIDHIGNDVISVPGQFGNLIIHDDGSWSYTLGDNTLQHTVSGGTGQADQVTDQFDFSVTDSNGSTATGGQVTVHILDDGPSLTVGDQTVDETGGLDTVTGTLSFAHGADGPGTFSLAADGATWDTGSQMLTADDGSWQLVVNPSGGYTFTQLQPMNHPDGTNPDDALTINVTATVTDGDNDSQSQDFTVTVLDDGPFLTVGNQIVDETDGLQSVPGTLVYDYGADGPGTFTLAADGATWHTDTQILTADDGSWQLAVDPAVGYIFTQLRPMDHPDTSDPNDPLTINVTATVSDSDNDSQSLDFTVTVLDDGPTLSVDNQEVDETGGLDSVQGTLNFSYGTDIPGTFGLSADGATWHTDTQMLAADDGSWQMVVNPAGGYTFTQLQPMAHPDGTNPNDALTINVTATVIDGDNDSQSKDFTITVLDDGPELQVGNVTVDETDGLDANVPGTLTYGYGTDGPGTFTLAADGATWDTGSQMLAADDGSWQMVVNPAGGYTFTQLQPMAHPDGTNPNDALTINVTATVIDGDNDSQSKDFTITVLDDGPELQVGNVTVDETDGLDANVPGTLTYGYGTDGPGTFTLAADGATWDTGSQMLAADDGSWQMVVNPAGGYTFTQLQPMAHPDGTNPNDALTINVTATVTDGDNDSQSKDFTVTILDDGPVAGNPYDAILANQPGNTVTGDLRADFNEDGPSANPAIPAVQLSGRVNAGDQYIVDDEGELITSGGQQLVYQSDGNGGLIAVTATDSSVVFSVSVDVDDTGHASYTVTLDDTNHLDTVSKDEMVLTYDALITDGDGDTDTASFDVSFVHIENPATGGTQLVGTTDDEVIAGSSGNDYIDGHGGSDVINAGAGNDIITTGSGNDIIDAGSGNDTVVSSSGDDVITGGDGNDVIAAGDGNDTVIAGDGDDRVSGGSGNDTLSGGAGNDTLTGGTGDDQLHGGTGNDTLQGDAGNDVLVGGAGEDVINGGADNDTLFAGEETDGDGQDQVTSGTGADTYVDVNNDNDSAGGDIAVDSMEPGDQNMDDLVPPPEPV